MYEWRIVYFYNSSAVDGNAYELRQRGRRSDHYNAGCRDSNDPAEPEYDKLNIAQRRLPAVPSNCEELLSRGGRDLAQTGGECNIYEAYSENDINADASDYAHPETSQQSISNNYIGC